MFFTHSGIFHGVRNLYDPIKEPCKPGKPIFAWHAPFSKSKSNLKSDHVNHVASASPIECLPYLPGHWTQCPGDAVQTGTGKVDPARKFKCTSAVRD